MGFIREAGAQRQDHQSFLSRIENGKRSLSRYSFPVARRQAGRESSKRNETAAALLIVSLVLLSGRPVCAPELA